MAVYKDGNKPGYWRVVYRFKDWTGETRQTQKRGFATRREAIAWEREQALLRESSMDMTFSSFAERYEEDIRPKLKENTWVTKEAIIKNKLLPYFGKRRLSEITAHDIMAWQNAMLGMKKDDGESFSPTYLKTVNTQLSAMFNHAVKYYGLRVSPLANVKQIGTKKTKEMLFWTKDEYLRFAEAIMDKPMAYYAFEMLYWSGLREGELLALTLADFDFQKQTVTINKSYQRIKGKDLITTPKTAKSNRIIKLPAFLADEMKDYLASLYDPKPDERIFPVTKYFLSHEMTRGCKASGMKKIRIHDLRHSHVSLLIEMHFPPTAIADRLGHETIDITLHYAHMFPSRQDEMAEKLDIERMSKQDTPAGTNDKEDE